MIKCIALLKRKPGITHKQFADRWLNEHTKLSSQLPGCLGYYINVADAYQPAGAGVGPDAVEPIYDGTAELWWESVEAMEASFATEIGKIAGADADDFCEVRIHIYTTEYCVIPAPAGR
jgi:uncharacterized protein (TIGR02118 family)